MPFANTAPLRRELVAALPQRPFALRFWDGTEVPATDADAPTFSFRSPEALAHVIRAPGELGLGRAYVLGLIETDDIEKSLRVVDTFEPPRIRRPRWPGWVSRSSAPAAWSSRRARPPPSCGSPGSATRWAATGGRSPTTTTRATRSSRCSWTPR